MGLSTIVETQPAMFVGFQTAGHGTSQTALMPATTPPNQIDHLLANSSDVVSHVCTIWLGFAGTYYPQFSATVPAGAGNGTVAAVDLILAGLPAGFDTIVLPTGWIIAWTIEANITSGQFQVTSFGGFV